MKLRAMFFEEIKLITFSQTYQQKKRKSPKK